MNVKDDPVNVLDVLKPDLESIPRGVTFRDPISMARDIPGASRSITSLVAWTDRNTERLRKDK